MVEDDHADELARTRALPIHDATRVGYPERMRKYRRDEGTPENEPRPDE